MVTTMRCCVISRTVFVLGTETSMPDCRTGAVSMKMMSSTSTTSTSGVMLISERDVRVAPLLAVKATGRLPFDGVFLGPEIALFHAIEQLTGEVVHAGGEISSARSEAGVCDDGGGAEQG